MSDPIHVAAGVINNDRGDVLLAKRLPGSHLAGQWEFPGGKLQTGETPHEGLIRELKEELAIDVLNARPLIAFEHRYPDKHVWLDVWHVARYRGEPTAVEGHELDWVPANELHSVELLTADKPIATAINLPDKYVVSAGADNAATMLSSMDATIAAGGRLIQIRTPGLDYQNSHDLLEAIAQRCSDSVSWLINGNPRDLLSVVQRYGASGIHMPARYLGRYRSRPLPNDLMFAVSCHDRGELRRACDLDADFAVLGPVSATPSHPGNPGLGWEQFANHVTGLPIPVYAIGGMRADDIETAWSHGAQGVAGIRDFWVADV